MSLVEDTPYTHEEHGRVVLIRHGDGEVEFLPEEADGMKRHISGMVVSEDEFREKTEPATQTINPPASDLAVHTPNPGD